MKRKLDEKDIAILECLEESGKSLGSWNLIDLLERRGIAVSSATIGRVLSRLESAGYVYKVGNLGRNISSEGVTALAESKSLMAMNEYKEELERVITEGTLENFIVVLQARRAVERETARLAALNITDAELNHLNDILLQQEQDRSAGKSVALLDIEFHKNIAHASRNRVLESMYHMLFTYGQQTALFEQIRQKRQGVMTSHWGILEALRQHDQALAEEKMLLHIDNLIQDVTTYWDSFENEHGSIASK